MLIVYLTCPNIVTLVDSSLYKLHPILLLVNLGMYHEPEYVPIAHDLQESVTMLWSKELKGLIYKNLQNVAEGGMAPRQMIPTVVICCP